MVPFESLGMVSYSPSIVAMAVSVAVCEIFSVKEWCDLKNGLGSVQGHWKWHHLIDLLRFRISALAARTSRGRSVCSRSPAARPRHSRTPDTSLAAMQCVNASRTSYAYWRTASPSDMCPPIYSTPPCQSQRCQEELIYGRRTADVSTYHECHHWSVLERSPLQACKPGTDCLQPFDILTVSLVSSVNSKLYFSWRHIVSVNKQF